MFNKALVGIMVTSALTGCINTTKEVCPSSTRVEIDKAEIAGKNSESSKVIVLPVDIDFEDVAAKKLQSVFRDSIEGQVYETGAELVDRKIANKLTDEIKLAEQSGRYNVEGVPIADFAVITEITSSELTRDFRQAYTSEVPNLLTGKTQLVHVPARCTYEVDVKANVKVVTLPEMKVVQRYAIEGDNSTYSETNNSSCPISNAQYTSLASKAASESVAYSTTIKQTFASSGIALELRQCEIGSMVKISMGKNKKIVPDMDIQFISQEMVDNGDGTKEIETHGYGDGQVINNPEHGIKEKYSWVIVEEETALKIHKGDKVKVGSSLKCGLLDLECHSKKIGL